MRVNAGIVLCVRPVRNVLKCEYGLITTEQLTITHPYSHSYSDINLCFCQYLYVFSVRIACRYRAQTTLPKSGNFKFKPTALCTISVLCCVSNPQIYYFIWQLTAANSCLFFQRIIVATVCRLPTRVADWLREVTNDSCRVKCGCNRNRTGALASVSQLFFCIISLHFLYLFFFCLILLSPNIIAFC